jgi:hypothetical protein
MDFRFMREAKCVQCEEVKEIDSEGHCVDCREWKTCHCARCDVSLSAVEIESADDPNAPLCTEHLIYVDPEAQEWLVARREDDLRVIESVGCFLEEAA